MIFGALINWLINDVTNFMSAKKLANLKILYSLGQEVQIWSPFWVTVNLNLSLWLFMVQNRPYPDKLVRDWRRYSNTRAFYVKKIPKKAFRQCRKNKTYIKF